MLRQRLGVTLGAQLGEQRRRPLHIGEEERDCPGRKLRQKPLRRLEPRLLAAQAFTMRMVGDQHLQFAGCAKGI